MLKKFILTGLVLLAVLQYPALSQGKEESASLALEMAESAIIQMKEKDLGTTYANDTLNEAKALFSEERYLAAESLANKVLEIKNTAEEVKGMIDDVEEKIYEASSRGYNVSEASVLFGSGLEEFRVDNYEDAEKLMNSALNELEEAEAEGSLKKAEEGTEPLRVLMDNLWLVIIFTLAVLVIGGKIKRHVQIKRTVEKRKRLNKEHDRIENLIRKTQKKYFRTREISKLDYEVVMGRYQKRLSAIEKELRMLGTDQN